MAYKDLPPFISTDDLSAFMGVTVDTNDLMTKIAMDSACDAVRSYLDQDINLVTSDVEYHSGHGWLHDRIRLRQRPVVSVASVEDSGVILTAGSNYRVRDSFIVMIDGGFFYDGNDNVKITYTHGWTVPATSQSQAIPADIRLVALSIARRVWTNEGTQDIGTIRSEKIGEYSYTTGDGSRGGGDIAVSVAQMLRAEKDVLDKYRIGA